MNVEHLLDVFTSIGADSKEVWGACIHFMDHLRWHKPRLVVLGPKFEALPDNRSFKPRCLFFLSRLFDGVGNWEGQKRALVQSLGLWRERGKDLRVAETLVELSDANRALGLCEEGIQQAKEALDILGKLGKTNSQVECLMVFASLLREDEQLDMAEEVATLAMDLSGDQYILCQAHLVLGRIHRSKGDLEKAVHHFEESLRIASTLNAHNQLSRTHLIVGELYLSEGELDKAHAHIEHAKLHAGSDMLNLGFAFLLSALAFSGKNRPEEANSEALRALALLEGLGAMDHVETIRGFLRVIEECITKVVGELHRRCTAMQRV